MFEFRDGNHWWKGEETLFGYTAFEASEKARALYTELKNKIHPGFYASKPWLYEDFVWDIVRPGGEEDFRKMVARGGLKDDEGCAGYEWRLTN